jgi:beta-galactosidase
MAAAGLSIVRIGEFAWSRIEPESGNLQWEWMDRAINILGEAGLDVVLGTPTATPPRWMVDKYPDMLAVDADGHPRKFGSRRHYCFSHVAYKEESVRIAELMAQRYGKSDHVSAWQIDNEYGCHDTVVSYSDSARLGFRYWLRKKYASIHALNSAWGNIFWSMEYSSFEQVDLPNLTVTEPNPAHVLDFRRFSSDQVVDYNRAQADVIREHSSKPLIHNYMGRITDFDHFEVGEDLEIASWDSYPLGFLEDRNTLGEDHQIKYARQGDPDFQAFHHDLYRAVGKGRWWVMEQQPGPVNWAPHNPAPLPGMVRLWSWEAIAHHAEAVCYFRWRQAPFAQEQMHAGLLRPDSKESAYFSEVLKVAAEIDGFGDVEHQESQIALVFDYESCWAWETQPQGKSFDYFELLLDFYRELRKLGLSVDIIPPTVSDFGGRRLVIIPGLMRWNESLQQAIQSFTGDLLIGPRSGSKTENFSIPEKLAPSIQGFDCTVSHVESLRAGAERSLKQGGEIHSWFEALEGNFEVMESVEDGSPVLVKHSNIHYLGAWPNAEALSRILLSTCEELSIETEVMPEGVRQRRLGSHTLIFNYSSEDIEFRGQVIPAAGILFE